MPLVACTVARNFVRPIGGVAFHSADPVDAAGTTMPETAMNEDAQAPGVEDQVRCAREASIMKAEAQALTVKVTAHQKLGRSIPATDTPHIPAALFLADFIHRLWFAACFREGTDTQEEYDLPTAA